MNIPTLLGFLRVLLRVLPGLWALAASFCADAQQATTTTVATTTTTTLSVGMRSWRSGRISAGGFNGYAVDGSGALWIWGANLYGQLCDGSGSTGRGVAAMLPGVSGVVSVSAGGGHGLAMKADMTAAGWGLNSLDSTHRGGGQLGDGTQANRATPVAVGSLAGAVQVVAGQYHSLALMSDGSVDAWGYNDAGQLGDGSTTTRTSPVPVSGLSGVTAVAAGCEHSLALKSDGTVWAWGYNSTYQLGDGTNQNRATPVRVNGLSNVTAIAAGCAHSLALRSDGTVWAWGFNFEGELGGASSAMVSATPARIPGLGGVTAISAGGYHSLALKADGSVWSWGKNDKGQLGDGSTSDRSMPAQVNLKPATEVAAGFDFSMALATDGSLAAWGNNSYGQLGIGTTSGVSAMPATVKTSGGDLVLPTTAALVSSWNLLGNSNSAPLSVAAVFGDAAKVVTVWKWLPAKGSWAFYSPALGDGGAAYAASKGYDFLTTIDGGEGFWVNAKTAFTAQLPTAAAVTSASFRTMASGWNLNAIGDNMSAPSFNRALSATPPAAGGSVPQNVTSVWTWDAVQNKWYFYAPALDADGSLASYLQNKGYLDFAASGKTLAQGVGFWVSKP